MGKEGVVKQYEEEAILAEEEAMSAAEEATSVEEDATSAEEEATPATEATSVEEEATLAEEDAKQVLPEARPESAVFNCPWCVPPRRFTEDDWKEGEEPAKSHGLGLLATVSEFYFRKWLFYVQSLSRSMTL